MNRYIKEKWYTLSIRNKQLVFFGIIIFLVSLIWFYTQQNTYKFMNNYNDNLNQYYRINKLHGEISQNAISIENYIRESRQEDLESYITSKQTVLEILEEVDRDVNTLDTYLQVNAIKSSINEYFTACEEARKIDRADNYYIPLYEALKINNYIKGYIQQLLNISLREGNWFYNNELVPEANYVRNITLVSIILISLLCLFFAVLFSNYLTKPIRKLAASSIKMSEGNLDIEDLGLKSKDEVGILGDSFTKMSISIKRMVDDLKVKSLIEKMLHEEELKNVKMEQLLKEAEFMGLQSQINPHFLFNTLNIIARTSMFENAENTTKLILYLSAIFRYNLESQSDYITLSKEIEITEKYIYIQKYRFGDRLKFDVQCNVNTDQVYVPRFTLQPLVENAIIHGIEPKESGGSLRVKVFSKNDKIQLRIIDNGTGIPFDRKVKILNSSGDPYKGHTTGIGITNVMTRLRKYLSNDECFKIYSKERLGTIVTLTFPKKDVDKLA